MNLSKFLEEKASQNGFQFGDFSNDIIFTLEGDLPKRSSGVVYGFIVKLDKTELNELLEEASDKGANKQSNIKKIKPIYKTYYPLYWGKSTDIYGRLLAHIEGHKNSNLRLKDFNTLKNKKIYFGRIYVKDNEDFENYLICKFPCILKTRVYKEINSDL